MHRKEKLDSLLSQEIAEIISRRLDAPLDFLITIANVDSSPDLESAKIHFSVLPDSKENEAKKFLILRSGEIKKWLAKGTRFRKIPKLRFVFEKTEKKAREIEEILNEIKDENTGKENFGQD
ncbi:MAG TPA: 30S ribosome-binding factor RbfA [Candidatus Bipolaricaulota bacterium]|nr:30S ribosome-binding factor RbfA [Candidatus Bipolaricaulota bacterium]